jgi:threonine/homoserine/homoserine lactone efflux protein
MLNILQNVILGISLAAPIGPVNVEVIKRGLKHGFIPAFLTGVGAASADTTWLLAIYLGLANFINSPFVKTGIWAFGAIVLIYLGYLSIKSSLKKTDLDRVNPKARRNSIITGYLITISNPMTIVWWFGIYGSILGSTIQYVSGALSLLYSLTIIVGVLLWFFTISALLHWGKRFINENTARFVSAVAGIVLIGFGLYFSYNAIISVTS